MPPVIGLMLLKAVFESVRTFRSKRLEAKPETLCTECRYAHVQYAVKAKRAVSCTYGGAIRPVKLDVLYCTDYEARNLPMRARAIGFVREIISAESLESVRSESSEANYG